MTRPRPVADVPPAALADGQAVAKAWLLALLAARPLQDAPALPIADLTRDGPPLCAAVLRAVGSDSELPGLDALAGRAGELAGAASPADAVAAVAQLRGAIWKTLVAELGPLDGPATAALAERVGCVCDVVAVGAAGAAAGGEPAPADFRLHDAREDGRDADWRGAAARHLAAERPFTLLAVELDDAARLMAADADGSAARVLAAAEEALRAELRPGDVMQREPDGRLWVVAADLAASGGRSLAERLADAAGTARLHGAPLTTSIGVAAFPADGTGVGELEARADEGLFAARAAGVPIA